jgi:ABC-type lipoprotein export system ATPase subunit
MMTRNPVGSIWHRWDPHLHAPGTLLNDQFGGNWETYLETIEKATPSIAALGVTDYFCIQTYKEVRKRKAEGRLPGVEFIFPNVELRIETKTADQSAINIHLLFSPLDPNHEENIERNLGLLSFEFREKTYRCERAHLVALGKDFDPSQKDDLAALRVGANQFKTTLKDLKNLFRNERWMRDNALVAITSRSGDGTSGLQDDSAFAAMRTELERFADIIFSSREKDRQFWLGELPQGNREFIEDKYNSLKPCLHGSDAHSAAKTGAPMHQRFCWLKGDLTFETLRQAVIEPASRVWIGSQPPSSGVPAITVQRVEFEAAPWMKQDKLDLNGGLIAIVGARGSGKTALADLIATGAFALDAGKGTASFLKRASSPVNHLGAGSVTLTWGDSETTGRAMAPTSYSEESELVRYLSQHFVERLCSAEGLATELREAMERVVFESTEPIERLESETFSELADQLLDPIRTVRGDLQKRIASIGDVIVQEEMLRERLPKMNQERVSLAKKIESARKLQQSLISKDNEEHAKQLAALESASTASQMKVEVIRHRQKAIDDLGAAVKYLIETAEPARFADMQQKYSAARLSKDEWEAFKLQLSGDAIRTLAEARARAEADLKEAMDGNPARDSPRISLSYAQWPLNLLKAERDRVKALVGIDAERKRKYDQAQKLIALDEGALSKLDSQLAQAKGASERRDKQVQLRRELYSRVFEELVKEEAVLDHLYAPLSVRLAGAKGTLGRLVFVTERTIDLDTWCARGEEQFDLRSGSRIRGRGGIKKLAEHYLLDAWRYRSSDEVATAMESFRGEIWKDLKNMPPWVDADDRIKWNKSVSAWLYDTSHIRLRYGIEYDGVAIEQLSPGTRGVVLLLLYLAVDLYDQRPLIIDQPEENLDPNSVFEELVPHFREVCKRRQVIVVTHNANLVINTDADQVIVASSRRSGTEAGLPEIDYQTGSLENPAIRRAVCQILEGGERAFLERERRYRIRWGHNLLLEG